MKILSSSVFKMDKRIYFVFILVVTVAIANAVLSTIKIRNNKNTIFEITQSTNPTLENLEEFNLLVTRSRMFISNWVYLPNNNNDKSNLVQLNKVSYPGLKNSLAELTKGWRSESDVKKVEKLFAEYETVIREQEKIMKSLVKFDDYEDPLKKFLAEEQLESEIIPSTNKIMVNLRELIVIKKAEARHMQNAMLQDNVHLLVIVFSLAILVIVSVMMAGIYMMKKVIVPLMRVREILLQMSAGELPEVKLESEQSAFAEMKTALYQLREGLQRTSSFAGEIGKGNFDAFFQPLSANDVLGSALLEMRNKLKQATDEDAIRNWASEGYAHISSILHKNIEDINKLSGEIISNLVEYIDAGQGAVYLVSEAPESNIERIAFSSKETISPDSERFTCCDEFIVQAVSGNAVCHLSATDVAKLNLECISAFNGPGDLLIVPLFSGGRVIGAIEIKSLHAISASDISLIEKIAEPVAANILNLKANLLTRQLLEESQIKTTELALQDEELRQINNELMIQSRKLKDSESTLRKQSDVLQTVNSELQNKALLLEEKNMAVEDAHKALAFKATQLEKSNKYKSDFLANMSHELRTPLNSVLILARLLSENRSGNMTEKQIEHSKVIHKSGSDLLIIINDILDLSKIEAGKLELQKEKTEVSEICTNMMQLFMEVSRDKKIIFTNTVGDGLPKFINTDRVRIEQVLKNLLGNAFKFTSEGGIVTMKVEMVNDVSHFQSEQLRNSEKIIAFTVCDSGIGIPEDQQKLIFDAFNQADSSITRKFGGTGLGLAICRQLSTLLGGEIGLSSREGTGSEFSLYVSADSEEKETHYSDKPDPGAQKHYPAKGGVLILCDNHEQCQLWEMQLAIENYSVVGKKLSDALVLTFFPDIIVIDATLADKEYVSRVKKLKEYEQTKNAIIICRSVSEYVPVEIKSMVSLHSTAMISEQLIASIMETVNGHATTEVKYLNKSQLPVFSGSQSIVSSGLNITNNMVTGLKILIADDDIRNIYSMTSIFENVGAEVICAMDGFEAVELFKSNRDLSLILMDVMMPGKDGLQAIREIRAMTENNEIPIIAVTAKAMIEDREVCLQAGANDYITKPVQIELLFNIINRLIESNNLKY